MSNIVTLSEQHYFVWDPTSQRTKRQHMLEIWGPWTVFAHGCVYDQIVVQEYTVCMVLSTRTPIYRGFRNIPGIEVFVHIKSPISSERLLT